MSLQSICPIRLLCLLCIGAPVVAAPSLKKDAPNQIYFMTNVGDQRIIEAANGNNSSWSYKVETVNADHQGTMRVVTRVESGNKKINIRETHEVSLKGVVLINELGNLEGERVQLLKLPGMVGDTWTNDGFPGEIWKIAAVNEEVEVKGGKFRCVRVEHTYSIRDGKAVETTWFAPKIGVVKKTVRESDKEKYSSYLKSFQLAK